MQIFSSLRDFNKNRRKLYGSDSVGLVPTMGALHEGHASLARRAVAENDFSLATIFVNPTQFGPNEDLDKYPRTLEKDFELLEALGVSAVLAPNTKEIYAVEKNLIRLEIDEMADKLCGAKRPGHFNGVLQIVSILFHLTQPNRAYFGKKDFQQLMIIQRLVKELHFPVEIIGCPIVREADGLAMSSRNRYLNPEERKQALFLSKTLKLVKKHFAEFSSVNEVHEFVQKQLEKYPLAVLDYFEVLRKEDLSQPGSLHPVDELHLFVAAFLGKTRLIDNLSPSV